MKGRKKKDASPPRAEAPPAGHGASSSSSGAHFAPLHGRSLGHASPHPPTIARLADGVPKSQSMIMLQNYVKSHQHDGHH